LWRLGKDEDNEREEPNSNHKRIPTWLIGVTTGLYSSLPTLVPTSLTNWLGSGQSCNPVLIQRNSQATARYLFHPLGPKDSPRLWTICLIIKVKTLAPASRPASKE